MGDAINWEWIINCAMGSGKDIIVVSRDNDYGVKYDDKLILNDWLSQEFKSRISRRRKILLTDRLAEAFKIVSVKISEEEERREDELIQESSMSHSAGSEEIYPESNPLTVGELVKRLNKLNQQRNKIMHGKSGSDS